MNNCLFNNALRKKKWSIPTKKCNGGAFLRDCEAFAKGVSMPTRTNENILFQCRLQGAAIRSAQEAMKSTGIPPRVFMVLNPALRQAEESRIKIQKAVSRR